MRLTATAREDARESCDRQLLGDEDQLEPIRVAANHVALDRLPPNSVVHPSLADAVRLPRLERRLPLLVAVGIAVEALDDRHMRRVDGDTSVRAISTRVRAGRTLLDGAGSWESVPGVRLAARPSTRNTEH